MNTRSTGAFRARVHRGTRQIGGTCIELETDGQRILLDLGLPLDADGVSDDLLPDVAGLRGEDPSLSAIVISHGHGDHWGLLSLCKPAIPLVMGAATARIMGAAAPFAPNFFAPSQAFDLQMSLDSFLRRHCSGGELEGRKASA
jgi:ribonuclease J